MNTPEKQLTIALQTVVSFLIEDAEKMVLIFNTTKDPELKELLNDITPTLVACRLKLETFIKKAEKPPAAD